MVVFSDDAGLAPALEVGEGGEDVGALFAVEAAPEGEQAVFVVAEGGEGGAVGGAPVVAEAEEVVGAGVVAAR